MRCQACESHVETAPRFCEACGGPLAAPTVEPASDPWPTDTLQFGWAAGPDECSVPEAAEPESAPADVLCADVAPRDDTFNMVVEEAAAPLDTGSLVEPVAVETVAVEPVAVETVAVETGPEQPAAANDAEPAPPPWWVAQRPRGETEITYEPPVVAPASPPPPAPRPELLQKSEAAASSGALPGTSPGATPGTSPGATRRRPAIVRLPATAPAAPRRIRPYNPDWTRAAGVAAAAAIVVSAVGVASVQYWARIDATTSAGGLQPEPILSVATIDPTVLNSPSLEVPVAKPASEAVAAASAVVPAPPAPARAPAPARRTPRAKRPASPATPSPAPAANAPAEPEPAPLAASQSAVVVPPTAMPQAPTAATTPAWSPAGGSTFEPNQVDVRPQVVHSVDPQYPEQLRERGSSDVVVVRVLVSPDGRPADARVLRPSRVDPAFDRAALAAVTEWRFSPARKRDRPVACWFNVGIAFPPR